MHWLIGPQSSILSFEQQVLGGNATMVTSLHDTAIRDGNTSIWSVEPLFSQFSFDSHKTAWSGTNCFCSAFSLQQCQLKADSQLEFNISLQT